MSVLINFKICDNAKECNGIEMCPTGAIFWDEKNKTISYDESKCNKCGVCDNGCPEGAIHFAKTKEDYERIKKEIDDDPRTTNDLFIDRYGAQPVRPAFQEDCSDFQSKIVESNKLACVELYNLDEAECLIKSIPIKTIFKDVDVKYRKIEDSKREIANKYNVKELPALLFFKREKMIGKIEGYYENENKQELINKINELIK